MVNASESLANKAKIEALSFEKEARTILFRSLGEIVNQFTFEYAQKSFDAEKLVLGESPIFIKGGYPTGLYLKIWFDWQGEFQYDRVTYAKVFYKETIKSRFKFLDGKIRHKDASIEYIKECVNEAVSLRDKDREDKDCEVVTEKTEPSQVLKVSLKVVNFIQKKLQKAVNN